MAIADAENIVRELVHHPNSIFVDRKYFKPFIRELNMKSKITMCPILTLNWLITYKYIEYMSGRSLRTIKDTMFYPNCVIPGEREIMALIKNMKIRQATNIVTVLFNEDELNYGLMIEALKNLLKIDYLPKEWDHGNMDILTSVFEPSYDRDFMVEVANYMFDVVDTLKDYPNRDHSTWIEVLKCFGQELPSSYDVRGVVDKLQIITEFYDSFDICGEEPKSQSTPAKNEFNIDTLGGLLDPSEIQIPNINLNVQLPNINQNTVEMLESNHRDNEFTLRPSKLGDNGLKSVSSMSVDFDTHRGNDKLSSEPSTDNGENSNILDSSQNLSDTLGDEDIQTEDYNEDEGQQKSYSEKNPEQEMTNASYEVIKEYIQLLEAKIDTMNRTQNVQFYKFDTLMREQIRSINTVGGKYNELSKLYNDTVGNIKMHFWEAIRKCNLPQLSKNSILHYIPNQAYIIMNENEKFLRLMDQIDKNLIAANTDIIKEFEDIVSSILQEKIDRCKAERTHQYISPYAGLYEHVGNIQTNIDVIAKNSISAQSINNLATSLANLSRLVEELQKTVNSRGKSLFQSQAIQHQSNPTPSPSGSQITQLKEPTDEIAIIRSTQSAPINLDTKSDSESSSSSSMFRVEREKIAEISPEYHEIMKRLLFK